MNVCNVLMIEMGLANSYSHLKTVSIGGNVDWLSHNGKQYGSYSKKELL